LPDVTAKKRSETVTSQRDEKGRFLPGNKARAGKTKQSYGQILRDVLDEKTTRKIMKKAVEQAADGDHQARSWLFSFVLPKLHVVEYSERSEQPDTDLHGNPFDQPASPEMALLLDACRTIEEVDFISSLMDRAQANLPTGNPFEDVLNRPLDNDTRAFVDAMTPEERHQYSELMERAAERHRTQPVRPMRGLPSPS
jgi:hypothetical protein